MLKERLDARVVPAAIVAVVKDLTGRKLPEATTGRKSASTAIKMAENEAVYSARSFMGFPRNQHQ
jgi:hypothetical protein